MTSGKVRISELPLLIWGDVVKLNAIIDMEEDMQSAYRAYLTPETKKG